MKPEQVKPAILVLSLSALAVGEEIKALTGGEIHGLRGRVEECDVLLIIRHTMSGNCFKRNRL